MHFLRGTIACVLVLGVLSSAASAQQNNSYAVHNLVSDGFLPADHMDPNLVNSWGIARSPTSPWWVADADSGVSTIYNSTGVPSSLVVTVPGEPTGIVFNGGSGFVITDGMTSAPAVFLFASEDGTISGWNPNVPPPMPSTQAFVGVDRTKDDANYKGLAISSTSTRLYAADFHNARVDVYDVNFADVKVPGAFVDPGIPAGFAPFGIQALEGGIYVAYAMQDAKAEDEVTGPGLGYVSVFTTEGAFVARVASQGPLNAPWGMTIAPEGFGRFSGNLLVGNFGDGRINAYDLTTHEHKGHLKLQNHHPLVVDGLWGIGFGNGAAAGPTTTLFFAAGPDDEKHGLFGSITYEGN